MVLPPNVRAEEVVERGDRPPPGDVLAHLEPLGMLVEHRVDDVNERFVAGEEAVPAGQQIAFQPALALVFAEHFHHAAVGAEFVVVRVDLGQVAAIGHLQNILPAVRVVFIRAEQAEVLAIQVQLHHVAEELAHHPRDRPWSFRDWSRPRRSRGSPASADRGAADRHWRAGCRSCGGGLSGPVRRIRP